MSDDKIIDINSLRNILNTDEEDIVEILADKVLFSTLERMELAGFNITDDEFIKDMKIVHLLFIAALNRLKGIDDKNIEILDDCTNR